MQQFFSVSSTVPRMENLLATKKQPIPEKKVQHFANDAGESQYKVELEDHEKEILKQNNIKQQRMNGKFVSNTKNSNCAPKKTKAKFVWKDSFKIQNIEYPQYISDDRYKKKYQVKFVYLDSNTGIVHKKTIKFGKKDKPDFVDNGDEQVKKRVLATLRNCFNPGQQGFWRYYLLNMSKDLKENYMQMIQNIQ